MARYMVTVDYTTSAALLVEAPDGDKAMELVDSHIHAPGGDFDVMKRIDANIPEGLEVVSAEPAEHAQGIPMLRYGLDGLDEALKADWEQKGDERRCPFCGEMSDYERADTDEGESADGRWVLMSFECRACGSQWEAEYMLSLPTLTKGWR